MAPKSSKKRKSDKDYDFQFFRPAPQVIQGFGQQNTHRHLRFDAHEGHISSSSTAFRVPPSPVKNGGKAQRSEPVWVTDDATEIAGDIFGGLSWENGVGEVDDMTAFDPAYLAHLESGELDPDAPAPRRRTQSVSVSLFRVI